MSTDMSTELIQWRFEGKAVPVEPMSLVNNEIVDGRYFRDVGKLNHAELYGILRYQQVTAVRIATYNVAIVIMFDMVIDDLLFQQSHEISYHEYNTFLNRYIEIKSVDHQTIDWRQSGF